MKNKFKILSLVFFAIFFNFTFSDKIVKAEENETIEENGMHSEVTNLNLKGYVGKNLTNNVKYWQKSAYKDNTNIITQIYYANHSDAKDNSLSEILGTDYYSVDKYYDIDIVEKESAKKLGWTLKSMPSSFGDRDIRFGNDPYAITNWSGARYLSIKVDASEIVSKTYIRFCLEDDSSGVDSFNLTPGKTITTFNKGVKQDALVLEGGYLELPGSFNGYVVIPLNNEYYSCYYNYGGNNSLELSNIQQFQIAVKAEKAALDKTLYMSDFAIIGKVAGGDIPYDFAEEDFKYRTIWDISKVNERQANNPDKSSLQWYGEFVGKLLTGMAYSYKATNEDCLVESANEIINDLKEAQGEDGYLGVFIGGARYSLNQANWDLWNQYHCIVGLLEWYKINGNEDALEVAKKCIDCIYDTFKGRSYIVKGGFETNRGIAHGYAMMYQVTKDEKYLNEAIRIIDNDCQDTNSWYQVALRGGHYYRSSSARWEVLHMMMTLGILYEETNNEEYYEVMEYLWYDILNTDIHNDGGFTTNEGAIGDPYKDGVVETCCTIAWSAYTNEFYKISHKVEVVDELERSYYNALLGSLLDDDKYCTYNTPTNGVQGTCGSYDGRRVKSQQDISFQYNSGSPDMNCCQANLARGMGQIAEWACTTLDNELYLNYYGNSSIETKVGGKKVTLKQTTTYPLDKTINLEISGLEEASKFSLNLRIPSWSYGSTIEYDGKVYNTEAGEYFIINKEFNNGDKITINLDYGFHYWKGEKSQLEYSSIYYGPILLAMDETFSKAVSENVDATRDNIIDVLEIEKANITSATAYGAWAFFDINTDSGTLRLVDFASAGKYNGKSQPSTYYSWLTVDGVPDDSLDGIDRWKVSDKYHINAPTNVILDSHSVYPGFSVKFKVILEDNQEIENIKANDSAVGYDKDTDTFSFNMPVDDVTITITYKEINNKEEDKKEDSSSSSNEPQEEQEKKGCKGSGTTSLLSLGLLLALFRRKKLI